MIWIKDFNQTPGWNSDGSTVIDGNNYDLYSIVLDSPIIIFIKTSANDINTIHLNLFLKYLLDNSYILPEEYLSSIEFGNEIVFGSGETDIVNYSITIN